MNPQTVLSIANRHESEMERHQRIRHEFAYIVEKRKAERRAWIKDALLLVGLLGVFYVAWAVTG